MIDLYALDKAELTQLLSSWGEPPFRARQLWDWLYTHRVQDVADMHNLPRRLRERLQAEAQLGTLELTTEQTARDGTIKRLYALSDRQLVESVLMPYSVFISALCNL